MFNSLSRNFVPILVQQFARHICATRLRDFVGNDEVLVHVISRLFLFLNEATLLF